MCFLHILKSMSEGRAVIMVLFQPDTKSNSNYSSDISSSEALFAYWNRAAPSDLMDFFTLLEYVSFTLVFYFMSPFGLQTINYFSVRQSLPSSVQIHGQEIHRQVNVIKYKLLTKPQTHIYIILLFLLTLPLFFIINATGKFNVTNISVLGSLLHG